MINTIPGRLPILRNMPNSIEIVITTDKSEMQVDKKVKNKYSLNPQPAKVIGNSENKITIGAYKRIKIKISTLRRYIIKINIERSMQIKIEVSTKIFKQFEL